MSCQHCGAELPAIAMFCGECGRSVSARSAVPPVGGRPETPVSARVDRAPLLEAPPAPTTALEPESESELEPESESEPELEPESEREPVSDPVPLPEPVPEHERASAADAAGEGNCSACGLPAHPGDVFCAGCGHRLANDTNIIAPLAGSPPELLVIESRQTAPTTAGPALESPAGRSSEQGAQFVLQFSTGESYTVLGSGLAGRNPRPEPGEVVDHLVTIIDPGRSVSKTHLEFGQTDGEFWISDRHSGNGTVIREPGADPRPCTPGRRYRVERGSRIDLGEQYLLVI